MSHGLCHLKDSLWWSRSPCFRSLRDTGITHCTTIRPGTALGSNEALKPPPFCHLPGFQGLKNCILKLMQQVLVQMQELIQMKQLAKTNQMMEMYMMQTIR